MSAFIVNNYHIDVLVNYAVNKRLYYCIDDEKSKYGYKAIHCKENPEVIGQVLLAENYRSVNSKYEEKDVAPSYKFRIIPKHFSPVQILKACSCLNYQSCETDDYKSSEAHKIIDVIKSHAIGELPGYEDAEWEIREPENVSNVVSIFELSKKV